MGIEGELEDLNITGPCLGVSAECETGNNLGDECLTFVSKMQVILTHISILTWSCTSMHRTG